MHRARDVLVVLGLAALALPAASFASAGRPLAVAPGRIVAALEGQDAHGPGAVPRTTLPLATPDGGTLLFGLEADGT